MNNLISANIIICVCSPENSSGKPNPNVMYELGIAHALGKPTIILTNNIGSLPSDLATKYALKYIPEDMVDMQKKDAFVTNLRLRIQQTLQRSTGNLVDSDWETYGISLASNKYKMCLHPDFLPSFKTIVSFENAIQRNFQPIVGELSQLWKFIGDIVAYAADDPKRIKDFTTTWSDYFNYYKETKDGFLNSLESRIKENDGCFCTLVETAIKENEDAIKFIQEAQKSYEFIKQGLSQYNKLHEQLQMYISDDLVVCLRDENAKRAGLLVAPISQLFVQTRSVLVQSHNLISNLIKVF